MSAIQEAEKVVNTERQKDYGHPFDDFNRAMGMLNALGYRFLQPDNTYRELRAEDQAIIMTCVKLSREVNHHKWDNIVDIHGYMKCLEMVLERRLVVQEMRAADKLGWEVATQVLQEVPAHPDDDVAARLARKGLLKLEEWQRFKQDYAKQQTSGSATLIAFAASKKLSVLEVWTAVNEG